MRRCGFGGCFSWDERIVFCGYWYYRSRAMARRVAHRRSCHEQKSTPTCLQNVVSGLHTLVGVVVVDVRAVYCLIAYAVLVLLQQRLDCSEIYQLYKSLEFEVEHRISQQDVACSGGRGFIIDFSQCHASTQGVPIFYCDMPMRPNLQSSTALPVALPGPAS